MKKTTRRSFIANTTLGLGSLAFSHLPIKLLSQTTSMNIPIGFQTWSVRDKLSVDFAGTLKMMAGLGYKVMEMCSPAGYADAGFGPLVNMKIADMRSIISDAGLSCPSCHFGLKELTDHLQDRIEFAHQLGLTDMVCSSFGLPDTASLNDYTAAADKLNKAAEKIKKAGMQAGFHNHSVEFTKLNGQLIYDALLDRFDLNLVKMQFQTEVINYGFKASTYFSKYPGRFISAHLSDWTSDKKQAPIGQGIIDWKEFFATAKTAGVKHYFVEMDFETFKDSAKYIQGL